MAKNQNARTEFFTLPFESRFVWIHLATKRDRDFDGSPLPLDKQYYDATLIVPKTAADPNQCQNYAFLAGKIMPLIGAQPGWNGQWPQGAKWPIDDCDEPKFAEKHPWARGHWRIGPWSNNPIRVFDMGNNELRPALDGSIPNVKSGDYGLGSVNAFAWDTNKGGISFGIEGIKKTRDGDPVGGNQRSVEQMFGQPTGAPIQYAATGAPPLPGGAPQQPFTPGAGGGYPTSGGAPSPYAPPAAPMSPGVAPMQPMPTPYAAPSGAPMSGAYPSSAPPAPGYGQPPQPPGQPVAPPAYGQPTAPGPAYTAPAPGYAPQPPGYPPIGTR